jgi:malonate transporter
MLRVLEVTFPVFALVFCGFFGQRWRLLPERAVDGINAFVFFFALPAMLFRVVATQSLDSFTDGRFALGYVLAGLAVFFFTRAAALPARVPRGAGAAARARSEAVALGLTGAHGNIGYLGVPLVLELGRQYAPTVVLAIICDIFIVITLSIALLELERRHAHATDAAPAGPMLMTALGGLVKSPLVLSIAFGLAWTLAAPPMPEVMDNFIRILSSAAGPCALFAIGASLGDRRIELSRTVRALLSIKLIAHPALAALLLFVVVRADPASAAIGVLVASLPSASNSFIIAQRYGVDTREISAAILAGTFLALVTVSVVIWALGLKAG